MLFQHSFQAREEGGKEEQRREADRAAGEGRGRKSPGMLGTGPGRPGGHRLAARGRPDPSLRNSLVSKGHLDPITWAAPPEPVWPAASAGFGHLAGLQTDTDYENVPFLLLPTHRKPMTKLWRTLLEMIYPTGTISKETSYLLHFAKNETCPVST